MPSASELQIRITAKDEASKVLSGVGASAEKMGAAHTSAGRATQGLATVTNQFTGSLQSANPEMGRMASAAQQIIGSASTGFLGVAGAVAIAAGSFVQFGLAGGRLVTELTHLSNATGLSIERADFWSNALANVGAEAGSLTSASRLLSGGIETINEALEKSNPLSSKSAALFDALGGSVRDANGQLLSGGQALEKIIPQLAKMTDANERARVGQEVFGRSWVSIAPLIANYTKATEGAARQSDDLAKILGQDVSAAMVEYNTRMNDIKDQMEDLQLKALPPVLTLLDRMVTVLGRLASIGDIDIKFNISGLGSTGSLGKVGDVLKLSAAFLDPLNILGLRGGGVSGEPDFFGGKNVPGGGLNSAPPSGPGSAASSAAAAYNAEIEAKKALEKETNDYLNSVREAARGQTAYNEALETFNKEQGKMFQSFISMSNVMSAANALFSRPTREQADLQLRQAEQNLFKTKAGPRAVHFGPGEGPGTAAKVDKQLQTISAEHDVMQKRIEAANALLITESQLKTEAGNLRDLMAAQSGLIKDKLNPSINDLYPELRTAYSGFVAMNGVLDGPSSVVENLRTFARELSMFKWPEAPSQNTGTKTPIVQFGGPAWAPFKQAVPG